MKIEIELHQSLYEKIKKDVQRDMKWNSKDSIMGFILRSIPALILIGIIVFTK